MGVGSSPQFTDENKESKMWGSFRSRSWEMGTLSWSQKVWTPELMIFLSFFFSLKFSYSGRNWKKKSFVHFWRCWVLAVASGPSPVVVNRGSSLAEVWEFLTAVVSLVVGCGLHTQGLQSLWHMGFSVLSQKLPHSTWDLPGPGIEPVSPALAGRFPTMAPPGKSLMTVLFLS